MRAWAVLLVLLAAGCAAPDAADPNPRTPPAPTGPTASTPMPGTPPAPPAPPAPPQATPDPTPATPAPPPHDFSSVGLPADKRAFATPDWLPEGYLALREEDRVYEALLHGTRVVVPVHASLVGRDEIGGYAAVPPEDVAAFFWDLFDFYWHVFEGALYDEVRFPLRGVGEECAFLSATPVGFPMCHGEHAQVAGDATRPPHPMTEGRIPELFAHETFHVWNGGAIRAIPRDVEGFTVEAWFVEGCTAYYAARAVAHLEGMDGYARAMRVEVENYERVLEEAGGFSFQEIADRTPPPRSGPSPFTTMLYARGALVCYLLDAELAAHGASMDDVFRWLYRERALADAFFETSDVRLAAEAAAGVDLAGFFDAYVDGAAPVRGPIGYVDRGTGTVRPVAALADALR